MLFDQRKISAAKLFYGAWGVAVLLTACFIVAANIKVLEKLGALIGLAFWSSIPMALFAFRTKSKIHKITMEQCDMWKKWIAAIVAFVTILVCVLPMGLIPMWNGKTPDHRNQYELLAEAFLDGKIYLEYGDEAELNNLENPYDPEEREEENVSYQWDHAFYNGRYYVYFGVVPVLLAFLPYRILTGMPLTTYHATQLFVALTIIGFFVLAYTVFTRFFKKVSYGVYLSLCVACSVLSVWYSTASPALYCTAITAGIMLELWSIYFFIKAVYVEETENKQVMYAAIGSLLGALTFGCRPTIGLANLAVLPLLISYLKQKKITFRLVGKLFGAAIPYFVIAVLLMLYNHARFGDPFEFGQSYQLTVADQRNLGEISETAVKLRLINETVKNFIGFSDVTEVFPYVAPSSVFVNYPLLLLVFCLFKTEVYQKLKKENLHLFCTALLILPLLITFFSVLWSPGLMERYRMDFYFIMCILCIFMTGMLCSLNVEKQRHVISSKVVYLSVWAVLASFLFYLKDVDFYYPPLFALFNDCIHFWRFF